MESATILAIVVLGGMGSQIGVAIAAVVMIGGIEMLRDLDFLKRIFGPDFDPTQYRMLIFGLAMVLIMIWRPRGLISTRTPSLFLKERKTIAPTWSTRATADAPTGDPLLKVEHLTMRFGGLVAVDDLSFAAPARRHHRADRPERRRQDHGLQLHHRLLQADRGPHRAPPGEAAMCDQLDALTDSGERRLVRPDGALYLLERMPDYQIAKRPASPAPSRTSACSPA